MLLDSYLHYPHEVQTHKFIGTLNGSAVRYLPISLLRTLNQQYYLLSFSNIENGITRFFVAPVLSVI